MTLRREPRGRSARNGPIWRMLVLQSICVGLYDQFVNVRYVGGAALSSLCVGYDIGLHQTRELWLYSNGREWFDVEYCSRNSFSGIALAKPRSGGSLDLPVSINQTVVDERRRGLPGHGRQHDP